jgi:hypothetical protein
MNRTRRNLLKTAALAAAGLAFAPALSFVQDNPGYGLRRFAIYFQFSTFFFFSA